MLRKFKKLIILLRMHRQIEALVISYVSALENRARAGMLWGSPSEEEERELIELTRKSSAFPGPIIEIGSLFGLTAQLLATYKPIEKKLIAVECFAWNPFGLPPDDHRAFTLPCFCSILEFPEEPLLAAGTLKSCGCFANQIVPQRQKPGVFCQSYNIENLILSLAP